MYCTLSSDNQKFVIIFEKKQDARMFLELTSTTDWLIPQQSKEYFPKPPDQKTHRIRTTSIICKPNEPPSLFLLCKIAYLTRYMAGSKNAEYLSSHFLLNNENVPQNLDLNLVTMRALHLISNWTL